MALTVANCTDARLKKEMTVGPKTPKGRTVQELLSLAGHSIVVDGDVGPATKEAIDAFRKAKGLGAGGIDQPLMDALAQPLLRAVKPAPPSANLRQTIVDIAHQHLAEHPREVGGANRGAWVRLYMDGVDGPDRLWCAGFVCYIVEAAARAHGVQSPIPHTVSCDVIGVKANEKGALQRNATIATARPGDLFLIPKTKFDWIHVGIVVGAGASTFITIEGNTNDDGSREGHEVCKRTRAPGNVDIVTL